MFVVTGLLEESFDCSLFEFSLELARIGWDEVLTLCDVLNNSVVVLNGFRSKVIRVCGWCVVNNLQEGD